jgi:hypothetical protein
MDFFHKKNMSAHVFACDGRAILQEWIVHARIIILHICMYRASSLVHEICGENKENIIRFRSYIKSTYIIPMAAFSFL